MEYHFPTEEIQNNIFSFANPNVSECLISEYTVGHRIVVVQVYDPTLRTQKHITFMGVGYFSGPLGWTGADFNLMPWRETIQFYSELYDTSNLLRASEEIQREASRHYRLYTVSAVKPTMEIKLFALNGFIE